MSTQHFASEYKRRLRFYTVYSSFSQDFSSYFHNEELPVPNKTNRHADLKKPCVKR